MKNKLSAYLDDIDVVTVIVDEKLYHDEHQLSIYHDKQPIIFEKHSENLYDGYYKLLLRVHQQINLRDDWRVTLDESIEAEIMSGKVVRTQSFINAHDYQGNDLGVNHQNHQSTFKLWAPIAKKVVLLLESPQNEMEEYPLSYHHQGVWEVTIQGNLESYAYIYQVYVNGAWKTVKDPYAIASKANGEMAYVIDVQRLINQKHSYQNPDNLIIYEVSVRDFSSNLESHFQYPKKYLGMIETDLQSKQQHPIGFDYVKSLNVSHIQLMPIYDFTGVDELDPDKLYNWGYNPNQYFVPEGSFALDPNHPYSRINELREMIDVYHRHHIGIIMDVVYNHVDEYLEFPYEILVPGYSFRVDDRDMMTAFSGCKNDLDTSRPMIKKLMIDSLIHWVKLYQVDGFRFDLMGLLDYRSLNEAYHVISKLRKDIIFYGEGWKIDQNSQLAHMFNPKVNEDIGFFNDQARDAIKGSTFNVMDKGFAHGNMLKKATISSLLKGTGQINPKQSINYIECHDNHTFFDKTMTIFNNPSLTRKHQVIASVLNLFLPGIPFMHLGQEFYRSKSFVENSYNYSDSINQVVWNDIDLYQDDIELIRSIILLRRQNYHQKITRIQWHESALSFDFGPYTCYFILGKKKILIEDDLLLYLASPKIITNQENRYISDIGVYVFERKTLC